MENGFNWNGGWQTNVIARSLTDHAYILGLDTETGVIASLASTNAASVSVFDISFIAANNAWELSLVDTNLSRAGTLATRLRGSALANPPILRLLEGTNALQLLTPGSHLGGLPNGTVAYYPMNGTLDDLSGNGNSGKPFQTTPTTDRFGTPGSAIRFRGDPSSYAIVEPFTNFPTSEITVAFWMRADATSDGDTPFSYVVSGDDNEFVLFEDKNFQITIGGSDAGNSGVSAIDGLWHHVAITWRAADGHYRLYKDGLEVFSAVIPSTIGRTLKPNGILVFGQDQDEPGGGFGQYQSYAGDLDEFYVINRALDSAEIDAIKSGTSEIDGLTKSIDFASVTVPEVGGEMKLFWRGVPLTSGKLRADYTSDTSILEAFIDDLDRSGAASSGDELVIAEYRFAGNPEVLSQSRVPIATSNGSFALSVVNYLKAPNEVLFTAEPDGQIFRWVATNAISSLERQIFSSHYVGKAWHALTGVQTLAPGGGLVGLMVDAANPNVCDVIFWPPQEKLWEPVKVPQTAPIARILPEPSSGQALATSQIRLWDAEGNASSIELQFLNLATTSLTWSNAVIVSIDGLSPGVVAAHPTGTTHQVVWDAAAALGSSFEGSVRLRARAKDVSLTGYWSEPTLYTVNVGVVTNNSPSISAIPDQSVEMNSSKRVDFTIWDLETPSSDLLVSATSSNPSLIPDKNLVPGGNGGNRSLVIAPVTSTWGSAVITITVQDTGNPVGRNAKSNRTSFNVMVPLPRVLGDFNGDGMADILFQNDQGFLALWFMDGAKLTSVGFPSPSNVGDIGYRIVGSGDLNPNPPSDPDFVFQHKDATLAAWLMKGLQLDSALLLDPSHPGDSNWRVAGTGDFNRNGTLDLAFQHTDGTLAAWLMKGTSLDSASLFDPSHPGDWNWRVVGTGDFNRDGKIDLMFQHADGTLALWFMNGLKMESAALFSPSSPSDPGWRVVSTADRNGDGKPDLLFQHSESGDLAVWFMDGTVLLSASLLEPSNSGGTWKVVAPK